jgi:L-Ala-D/L-Glu epimerase
MKIQDATYHRYRVPFKVPFTTSQGLQQYREGLLLRLTTRDGGIGLGEIVPLTAFGTAPVDELEQTVVQIIPRLRGLDVYDGNQLVNEELQGTRLAPARFAIDTALLDLKSTADDVPLSRYLSVTSQPAVPINATISDMNAQGAATAATYAVMAGYQAIKMKVGTFADPQAEVDRVAAVRDALGPDVELRLDVNGGWSMEQSLEMGQRLAPFNIGYLEQPLPASDVEAMAQLRKQIPIPIAADEAVTSCEAVEELIELDAVDAIVIKAAIVGGLTAGREVIEFASSAGIRVVVTTAIETGVAITAALHLAATLPQPIPPCGLATAALLETDLLVESPKISGGKMYVPSGPGLGVHVMESLWTE